MARVWKQTGRLALGHLVAFVPAFLLGLALSRLLYEALFPRTWPGHPLVAWGLALLAGLAGNRLAARLRRRLASCTLAATPFLPLILNLVWLFDPAVDLVRSRLLFGGGLWLAAILAWRLIDARRARRLSLNLLWLFLMLLPLYLLTLPDTVGRADTFEFQVVTPRWGIVHPTGYPLYLLLGRLLTGLLPDRASFAWQLNLVTMLYALGALALLFALGRQLLGDERPALVAAVVLALTPTFWSQAIEAEVYSLHALLVVAALFLMVWLLAAAGEGRRPPSWAFFLLPGLIGLGLANHLTTVWLLPPALLTLFFLRHHWPAHPSPRSQARFWLGMALAGLLPLSLYATLPWRWAVVNGEPMGLARFLDWVIGGRFRGALRWGAWLHDPARYAVVGRLFWAEWGAVGLASAALGLLLLWRSARRASLVLLLAWLGFTFYSLNYYVPDLAVFLLPAQLLIAVAWGAAPVAILRFVLRLKPGQPLWSPALAALLVPALGLGLSAAAGQWGRLDRSDEVALTRWGQAVLALPLEQGAAILADSEKIAPLLYRQQAEGVRPDLDILVLPDEAAYRAELERRLASGQTVYLARFLPGLEGIYHLRSAGPLLQVAQEGLAQLPASATPVSGLAFGPIRLRGYSLQPVSPFDPAQAAVTLYWQVAGTVEGNALVYLRWGGEGVDGAPLPAAGQHAAGNNYPVVAWKGGEIVPDFHQIPRPILPRPASLALQVALGPPFAPPETLSWSTVAQVPLVPELELAAGLPATRYQVGGAAVSGARFPAQLRPQSPLSVLLAGFGQAEGLELRLRPRGEVPALARPVPALPAERQPFLISAGAGTGLAAGSYALWLQDAAGRSARCGWLQRPRTACRLGDVTLSGLPLPPGAGNFADKIALLGLDLPVTHLQAGGQLPVTVRWQALAPMEQDYTVFVQVLDASDRLVGQVDAWPLQGTFPTSQWQPGQVIEEPYLVPLQAELPPGDYRLQVGWYLLATLERLPLLDEQGAPVDDRVLLSGLVVP